MKSFVFLLLFSLSARADVLFIGDSLTCGAFGQQLTRLIAQAGHPVTMYCAVSSRVEHWMRGSIPSGQICQTMSSSDLKLRACSGTDSMNALAALIDRHAPSVVLVALGTNSLEETRLSAAHRQLKELVTPTHSLVWIGPPHLRADQARGFSPARIARLETNLAGFYTGLGDLLTDSPLLDSRPLTTADLPAGDTYDGVHRGEAAGTAWAEALFPSLSELL